MMKSNSGSRLGGNSATDLLLLLVKSHLPDPRNDVVSDDDREYKRHSFSHPPRGPTSAASAPYSSSGGAVGSTLNFVGIRTILPESLKRRRRGRNRSSTTVVEDRALTISMLEDEGCSIEFTIKIDEDIGDGAVDVRNAVASDGDDHRKLEKYPESIGYAYDVRPGGGITTEVMAVESKTEAGKTEGMLPVKGGSP
ncbi:hypothetical protein Cgig2_012322 [Carnegiea gigantea]|uniref:Uncharacterized protein n=1 Tax=Carnegiea gigantea TaxID=171969 RepID=A0A9Q1JT24_9CARY|nr:hypothetical protein Cgig2_012322 [Carnegiea gigantea]